jgi:hypothetical protein
MEPFPTLLPEINNMLVDFGKGMLEEIVLESEGREGR